ncbi:MAG: FAD-dependent oxidoreductase [Nitrospirota bacterium]|nr:FAD-dependent oxidoreductase [Nitrospirota bacterium]
MMHKTRIVIIGAGCSGLSVAWGLCGRKNLEVTLLEAAPAVGGLSRTLEHDGLRFDIGPHRLSPQLPGIVEKIRGLPGIDLLELENEHGVYFNGTVYSYPPKLRNMCSASSLKFTTVFAAGWLRARSQAVLRMLSSRRTDNTTFEDIILHSFGRPFSEMVAFPMIRKVWGTKDLHEDFARIRFELPTIGTMLKRFLRGRSLPGVSMFYYPRQGFGRIPDAMAEFVRSQGQVIELTANIRRIEAETIKGPFHISYEKNGREHHLVADRMVSTISNRTLIGYLAAPLASPIMPLAEAFPSRTMRLGILAVRNFQLPARVIIFPEEHIIFNRLSSFDQFSPELCPDGQAIILCDVICDHGSRYDTMSNEQFDQVLTEAVLELGWFGRNDILRAFNVRCPGAYPVLNHERYQAQDRIEAFFENSGIVLCGREASSDYNNAHNAIGKGFLVADYLAGNIDAETMRERSRIVGRLPIQD